MMDNPVARAVAQSLGLSPSQGEAVVKLLVTHLHSQVSPARAVSVPELGTFYLDENQLRFRADSALDAAIGGSLTSLEPATFALEQKKRLAWLRPTLIVLCVLLIGAAGYFGYVRIQNYRSLPLEHVDTSVLDDAAIEDGSDAELVAAVDSADIESIAEEDPGLALQPPTLSAGLFTLVVASLPDDASAQAYAADFRSRLDDIPVHVVKMPDGDRYRVTVGRSTSYEGILELRAQIPDLPDGTWLLELE